MIKLGIFLLPDAKLKKLINNNKIQIIRIFGNQKYVSHLPHCTLCVLDVSEKIMKVKKLKRAINIICSITNIEKKEAKTLLDLANGYVIDSSL